MDRDQRTTKARDVCHRDPFDNPHQGSSGLRFATMDVCRLVFEVLDVMRGAEGRPASASAGSPQALPSTFAVSIPTEPEKPKSWGCSCEKTTAERVRGARGSGS